MKYTIDSLPSPFLVIMLMPDGARYRVGSATTIEAAKQLIVSNERGREETFGGLIEAAKSAGGSVQYAIWRATWTRVS